MIHSVFQLYNNMILLIKFPKLHLKQLLNQKNQLKLHNQLPLLLVTVKKKQKIKKKRKRNLLLLLQKNQLNQLLILQSISHDLIYVQVKLYRFKNIQMLILYTSNKSMLVKKNHERYLYEMNIDFLIFLLLYLGLQWSC